MSEKKENQISENVLKISKNLKESAKFNKDNMRVEFDKDAFKANLPEGIDVAMIKKVDTFKQEFAIAQCLVAGEIGVEEMKKDKSIQTITSRIPLPVGKSITVLNREKMIHSPLTGEDTKVYGYGSARIVTRVPAAGITAVRSRLAELATKAGLDK